MVSNILKTKFAIEKTKRAGKTLLPIFSKDSVSDFTNEILREDEELRNHIIANPDYREVLEKYVSKTFKDYRGVLAGSRIIDSWDRVTSAIGGIASATGVFSGGLGELISQGEDVIEEIPKAIYALYYYKKTGDKKAIPYWIGIEAMSHIPVIGDAIDLTNAYVNRARKFTKEKVKEDMRKILPSILEQKVA